MSDPRAIGVFDSGIGGLTVLKELCAHFPKENFIYLGDTARLPYGSKSPHTIRKYSEQNIEFLQTQNVKAIVIACNSASTQMPEMDFHGVPLYNVITPGASKAVQMSASQRIGVLGTRATVLSQAYADKIHHLSPGAQVFSQSCPLFVPLAEEAWDQDPITNLIVFRYVQPVLQNQIDVLILGCTHYPLLKKSIEKVTGSAIHLVDSGSAVAEWLQKDFDCQRLVPGHALTREIHLRTTDASDHFSQLGAHILSPHLVSSYQVVNL